MLSGRGTCRRTSRSKSPVTETSDPNGLVRLVVSGTDVVLGDNGSIGRRRPVVATAAKAFRHSSLFPHAGVRAPVHGHRDER